MEVSFPERIPCCDLTSCAKNTKTHFLAKEVKEKQERSEERVAWTKYLSRGSQVGTPRTE
jgi:hypothetical protein